MRKIYKEWLDVISSITCRRCHSAKLAEPNRSAEDFLDELHAVGWRLGNKGPLCDHCVEAIENAIPEHIHKSATNVGGNVDAA